MTAREETTTVRKQGPELQNKLILISAHCMSKEKNLNALSSETGFPVHADEKKMKMMKCLGAGAAGAAAYAAALTRRNSPHFSPRRWARKSPG